jgi:hypothetical protein
MPKVQLIKFKTAGGGVVYVESPMLPESEDEKTWDGDGDGDGDGEILAGGPREKAKQVAAAAATVARETFEDTLKGITSILNSAIADIDRLDKKPDEYEINLGFTLGAEGSIYILAAKGEASFNIRVLWKRDRNSE